MEPEQPTNKKTLVIITIAVVLVVAGIFLLTRSTEEPQTKVQTPIKRVYTEAEKMQILADHTSSTPVDTPAQISAKLKILESHTKNTPADTVSTEDKLRIFEARSGNVTP